MYLAEGPHLILQSGLDYLQDLEYPFASVGLDVSDKWRHFPSLPLNTF